MRAGSLLALVALYGSLPILQIPLDESPYLRTDTTRLTRPFAGMCTPLGRVIPHYHWRKCDVPTDGQDPIHDVLRADARLCHAFSTESLRSLL